MSNSPPAEKDVEQSAQSGEEQDQMDREQEGAQGAGLGDFEVKEQDRWLPIANGMVGAVSLSPPFLPCATNAHWNLICPSLALQSCEYARCAVSSTVLELWTSESVQPPGQPSPLVECKLLLGSLLIRPRASSLKP